METRIGRITRNVRIALRDGASRVVSLARILRVGFMLGSTVLCLSCLSEDSSHNDEETMSVEKSVSLTCEIWYTMHDRISLRPYTRRILLTAPIDSLQGVNYISSGDSVVLELRSDAESASVVSIHHRPAPREANTVLLEGSVVSLNRLKNTIRVAPSFSPVIVDSDVFSQTEYDSIRTALMRVFGSVDSAGTFSYDSGVHTGWLDRRPFMVK